MTRTLHWQLRITVLLALSYGLFCAAPTGLNAGVPLDGASRHAIIKTCDYEDEAVQRRDVGAVLSDFLPGWFAVMPDGSHYSYVALKQSLISTFPYQKKVSDVHQFLSFQRVGKDVAVRMNDTAVQVLENPQTHQILTIRTQTASTDLWAEAGRSWFHKSTRIQSIKVVRNGILIFAQPQR